MSERIQMKFETENPAENRKTAVFGGTFNPIHNGHLALARGIAEHAGVHQMLLIPTATPPHKSAGELIAAKHRLQMCRLACEGDKLFSVDDCEMLRGGASYTSDTLELIGSRGHDSLYLICGADMFMTVLNWHESEKILRLATICSAPREDLDLATMRGYAQKIENAGGRTVLVDLPLVPVSSTMVRNAVRAGQRIDEFVPPEVADYIKLNRLYQ